MPFNEKIYCIGFFSLTKDGLGGGIGTLDGYLGQVDQTFFLHTLEYIQIIKKCFPLSNALDSCNWRGGMVVNWRLPNDTI